MHSSDSIDNASGDIPTFDQGPSHSWTLPRIVPGLTSSTPSPMSPVALTSAILPQCPRMCSPVSMSTAIPRQPSASSTASSSSGVSSMSESSKCSMPQNLASPENQADIQNFIYSSQMILQGQYNDMAESFSPTLSANSSTSPTVPERNLLDYRTPPPNNPVQAFPLRCYTSLLNKQLPTPPESIRLPAVVPSNKPLTPTMLISLPSTVQPIKSPIPTLHKPFISKLPTTSAPMSSSVAMQFKLPLPEQVPKYQALPLPSGSLNITSADPVRSDSSLAETTDSISYRTTPKNREKDRYISALALIELSKG